jgi:phytoene dehydrogenase-like protein
METNVPDTAPDVVVIGSGIGGLSCAAILARYGFDVVVCESHTIAGGAAHAFEQGGFRFDSGPSLYSGLSSRPSANPLRHVLDVIEEDLDWATYDTWGCCLPEGDFDTQVGATDFQSLLSRLRGEAAVKEWQHLQQVMAPLAQAATAMPPAAFRYDMAAPLTLGRFALPMLPHLLRLPKMLGAFSEVMAPVVQDPFIRHWLNLLCFLLSGLPAEGTSTAEMAFMFADWYRPGSILDYPLGGSGALVDALVRGLQKYGGQIRLGAHVEQILVKGNRAVGVRLRNQEEIFARRAVIANASVWDTLKLIPEGALPTPYRAQRAQTPECDSFMHLHLGIDAQGLRSDLACHYIVVNDWQSGVSAPQNVVVVSIPSVLDPTLAPPGKHAIHVYTPGNEPYALWQGLNRNSSAYRELKETRGAVLWQALERVIPDIRRRCEVTLVGTPLTHERFLRRHRGSYGPAIAAGKALFPGAKTPIKGLLCCGDSTFPGIGLPAVAASGMITANTLMSPAQQFDLLKRIE